MLEPGFATPADMALCRLMIRQGSRSFHVASLLLPARYRERSRMLYGFCRMADDFVDEVCDPRSKVRELRERLDLIYAGLPSDNPTDRAFADLVQSHGIPRALPDALIEGFLWDAEGRSYATLPDLTAYAVRVAGTVGVMMALLMGVRSPQALARAIDLGVAMQFSNIARDVEEDLRRGRLYLPASLLALHGVSPSQVQEDPARAAACATHIVHLADDLYRRADLGIAMLPASCRASIAAASRLYAAIGHQAAKQMHRGRAVIPTAQKFWLIAKALPAVFLRPEQNTHPCLEEGQFLLRAVQDWRVPRSAPNGLEEKLSWVFDMFAAVESRKP
jgi:phytoene synthase